MFACYHGEHDKHALKPFFSSNLSDPSFFFLCQAWRDVCGDVGESLWRYWGIAEGLVVKLFHQNQQIHIRWNPSKCCISLKWLAVPSCHSCIEFTFYHIPPLKQNGWTQRRCSPKHVFSKVSDCQPHTLIPHRTASTVNPGESGSTSNLRSKVTPQKEWFLPVSVFQVA